MDNQSTNYLHLPAEAQQLIGEFNPLFYSTSVPVWIKHRRAYPESYPCRIFVYPVDYTDFRIPRAIGQAYTAPYPYAAIFEINRPKPPSVGASPQIPGIRVVCLGPYFHEWDQDWRPVLVIPTGYLLRSNPFEPYLVSPATTPIRHIKPASLELLCPEWTQPFFANIPWKDRIWESFELRDRPSELLITDRELQPLRWLVQDFLITTIWHRDFQLRRYLPLYPGNDYHQFVTVPLARRPLPPLPNPPPPPPPLP